MELVCKHQEKWNEIAKYFTKRSLTEIVKMFIQLPYSNFLPSLDKETTVPKRTVKVSYLNIKRKILHFIMMQATQFNWVSHVLNHN